MEVEDQPAKPTIAKERLIRCLDWLQKQDSQEPKNLQNQNDIQFIIQTNNDRKNFLISVAEDEATVPPGIEESDVEPKAVPLRQLRKEHVRMECEWQACGWAFHDYDLFQKHVKEHIHDVHVIDGDASGNSQYVCLWDVCGYKTSDFNEIVRHINYHAYHARLLAIGFNGRATLKLARCRKDSSKRNQLPALQSDHCCMWIGCEEKFNSIQTFFDHVKLHTNYSEKHLCSWAGCGATFPRRVLLVMHCRSHTCERLIACYHCGMHFSCNRTLCDHLQRQNVHPNSTFTCTVCGTACASAYLLREHARQHISAYACAMCDMSAPSAAALAQHVRYRHFSSADVRLHACPHCSYRAVTKSDLRKHIPTHTRKKPKKGSKSKNEENLSDEDSSEPETKAKNKSTKKYACHMCPPKQMKVFSRGSRLTTHLVKVHEVQWPFGHSRFRYQISKDGMYRLTTTRYEFLDVSKKIVDGYSWPKESITNSFDFNVELKAEATETTPRRLEITFKNNDEIKKEVKDVENPGEKAVEITMCDVDEEGNIINSEIIKSDVVFT